MYSNLPLPKLLEIISRIVNDSGCTVRIVDEIPVQDREIRELCLQIYELRRAAQSIAHGELGVHFENCGCMATYLKDIMDRLKAVERGIKELAEGDTPELPRLGALGTYFELIGNTLQENRRLIEKYRNLSLTDMLTGLPNRRGFLALAEKSFARASRKRQSISFIMADIDHFKKVNDRHGHEAGDEVLRVVAQRFLDCLRVEDICCRYGGEEFLVMLYDTDVIRAALVAERLRKSIAGKPISTRGESSLPITPERGNVMRKYGGLCRCPTRFSTKPRKRAGTGSPPTCLKRMRGWRSKPSRLSKGEGACRGKRRSACARYGFLGKRLGDVPSERVGECHAGGWVALRRSKICTVEPLR